MEKNNYSHDKISNHYNENYSPLVSSRNKNKSYEIKDYNEYNPNSVRETTKHTSYFNNHLTKDKCRKIIYIKKQNIHLKLNNDLKAKHQTKSNKMKYVIPFRQKTPIKKTIIKLTPYQVLKQLQEERKEQIETKIKTNSFLYKNKKLDNSTSLIVNSNQKGDSSLLDNYMNRRYNFTNRNWSIKKYTSNVDIFTPQMLPNLNYSIINYNNENRPNIINESRILSNIYIRSKCKSSRFLKSLSFPKKHFVLKSKNNSKVKLIESF